MHLVSLCIGGKKTKGRNRGSAGEPEDPENDDLVKNVPKSHPHLEEITIHLTTMHYCQSEKMRWAFFSVPLFSHFVYFYVNFKEIFKGFMSKFALYSYLNAFYLNTYCYFFRI